MSPTIHGFHKARLSLKDQWTLGNSIGGDMVLQEEGIGRTCHPSFYKQKCHSVRGTAKQMYTIHSSMWVPGHEGL